MPLLSQGEAGEKGSEDSVDGGPSVVGGKEEMEEEEKFFDAVEVSSDECIECKSKSMGDEGVCGGEVGDEGGEREVVCEAKMGHKRSTSALSMNEAQLLPSSPVPDQLPVCSERTMEVGSIEFMEVGSIEFMEVSSIEFMEVSSIEFIEVSSIEFIEVSSIEFIEVSSIEFVEVSSVANSERQRATPRNSTQIPRQPFSKKVELPRVGLEPTTHCSREVL